MALMIAALLLTIFVKVATSALSQALGLTEINDLSAGELLSFFGVAAGLCFSVWAFDANRQDKEREEEAREKRRKEEIAEDLKKRKPQFEVRLEPCESGCWLEIINVGSENYTSIVYSGCKVMARRLFAGNAIKAKILKPCAIAFENEQGTSEEIVDWDWVEETSCPNNFFVSACDSKGDYWMVRCLVDGSRIVGMDITNG